jgi:hypothetical protein
MKYTKFFIILLVAASPLFSAGQTAYWILSYNTAIPMGDLNDYINPMSFRGMGFEGKYELNPNVTIGGALGWNVFYEKRTKETVMRDNVAFTGNLYRYLNAFPMTVNINYMGGDRSGVRPFIGLGVGTYYCYKRTEVSVIAIDTDTWHFGLQPEAGIMVPFGGGSYLYFSTKYNQAFKTSDVDAVTYWGLNIGLLWEE